MNYFSGYVKSWESKAPGRDTLANSMNRFVGSVRAAQGNPDAHYLLGDYYQGRGRHREAIEEFNKAIRIDPLFVKAYNGIAVSLDQMGEHERALEYYQAALAIQPELDYLYNNMGYSFLLQERYEEAAAAFEKANALSGGTDQPHPQQPGPGQQRPRKGRSLPRCPQTRNTRPLSSTRRRNISLKNGSFEEAREHYRKALTLDPDLRGARKGAEVATLLADVKRSSINEDASLVVDEREHAGDYRQGRRRDLQRKRRAPHGEGRGELPEKTGLQCRAPDECRSLQVRRRQASTTGAMRSSRLSGSRGPFPASRR